MTSIKATLRKELREAGWHSRGYLPHFDGGEITQTITLHKIMKSFKSYTSHEANKILLQHGQFWMED